MSEVGTTYQGQRLVLKHLGLISVHSHPWEKDWCVLGEFILARRLDLVFENRAFSLYKVIRCVLIEDEPCRLGPKLVNDGATLT